jgi:hypothetical protein
MPSTPQACAVRASHRLPRPLGTIGCSATVAALAAELLALDGGATLDPLGPFDCPPLYRRCPTR